MLYATGWYSYRLALSVACGSLLHPTSAQLSPPPTPSAVSCPRGRRLPVVPFDQCSSKPTSSCNPRRQLEKYNLRLTTTLALSPPFCPNSVRLSRLFPICRQVNSSMNRKNRNEDAISTNNGVVLRSGFATSTRFCPLGKILRRAIALRRDCRKATILRLQTSYFPRA